MDYAKMLDWVINYGLGNVLALFIAVAFWRILIFVLKENAKREDRLAGIIEKHLAGVEDNIEEFKRANEYQREEHKKMIETLDAIIKELFYARKT